MQHFASPFWLAAALETFKHASMLAVSDLDKKLSISGLSTRNQLSHVAGSGLYLGEHFHHVPFRRKG